MSPTRQSRWMALADNPSTRSTPPRTCRRSRVPLQQPMAGDLGARLRHPHTRPPQLGWTELAKALVGTMLVKLGQGRRAQLAIFTAAWTSMDGPGALQPAAHQPLQSAPGAGRSGSAATATATEHHAAAAAKPWWEVEMAELDAMLGGGAGGTGDRRAHGCVSQVHGAGGPGAAYPHRPGAVQASSGLGSAAGAGGHHQTGRAAGDQTSPGPENLLPAFQARRESGGHGTRQAALSASGQRVAPGATTSPDGSAPAAAQPPRPQPQPQRQAPAPPQPPPQPAQPQARESAWRPAWSSGGATASAASAAGGAGGAAASGPGSGAAAAAAAQGAAGGQRKRQRAAPAPGEVAAGAAADCPSTSDGPGLRPTPVAPEPKKRAGAAGKAVGPVTTAARAAFQALCEPLDDRGEAGAAAGLAGPGPGPGSEAARRCVGPALVRDVCSPQISSELRSAVRSARVLLVGLLYAACEGPVWQYVTNMQPALAKPQRDCLLKARRLLAKDPELLAASITAIAAAAAPAPPPAPGRGPAAASAAAQPAPAGGACPGQGAARLRPGVGVLATEQQEVCVGIGVMCLDQAGFEALLAAATGAAGSAAAPAKLTDAAAAANAPLYLLRTIPWPPPHLPATGTVAGGGVPGGAAAARGRPGAGGGGGAPGAVPRPALLSLLDEMLVSAPCPALCCNAKALIREALALGWRPPPPWRLRLLDPVLLAWLEAPQLAQRDEKEIEAYTLETLCGPRLGVSLDSSGGAGSELAGPLLRLRRGLVASAQLFETVRLRAQPWLRPEAVQVEMQLAFLLGRMEAVGMAVDAEGLERKAGAVQARMDALSASACRLLGGRALNLGSAAQLAVVLYQELRLPPPPQLGGGGGGGGQMDPGTDRHGRARTHLPTDEAALKHLAPLHPLPGLVLQYRALQNVRTKWLQPDWLPLLVARSGGLALPGAGGGGSGGGGQLQLPRLSCSWNQTQTATGRLSSSSPNLQAVTKYEVKVEVAAADWPEGLEQEEPQQAEEQEQAGQSDSGGGGSGGDGGVRTLTVVARAAFVAPAGRLLVSADYSQIELRLLAHLSGDMRLQQLLRSGGDVFRQIAAAWLRPGTQPASISSRDREQAKRIIYAIIYGMSPQGLAQALSDHGVEVKEATALRSSFLRHFAGVQSFITSSLHHARRHGFITTGLLGRRRPISGLASNDVRLRAEAERKVVNSIVQGSAADLIKMAMTMWGTYSHPPAAGANEQQKQKQPQPQQTGGAAGAATGTRAAATDAAPQLPPGCPPPLEEGCVDLIGSIHDEILFECDARPEVLQRLVAAVRCLMCGVVALDVPLCVKLSVGQSWGSLQELPDEFGQEAPAAEPA
ncbi:hypothetical protein CHLRE_06g257800v5 [Chlamydomonas reinhardtii]|uniref:DNA-directed DNA polymerase n=1 Tax=Chlamydomonas reinhardtii TaxID=3055 RepID=A0A2K3DMG2_CHLRE|nr:uncharacterized protein CHLRE_06g257800v5 [Chlamydomonas reinhardtii]PNW81729.1 hypothetical protein CHLRE_06g257800v5 [Chlamydomonas reinhardtii]